LSLNRHAAARDANEPAVLAPFKAAGWPVLLLREIDALVLKPDGSVLMVEVKNKSGRNRLTTRQDQLIAQGWPLLVLRTPEAAQALVVGYYEMRAAR
jgi:hypothetical protein